MPNPTTNSLRIIGGSLRSRKISFPDAEGLRPTADRIRETLFNWLQFNLQGKHCLDLFAGSGVLGIEALSRGAASSLFLEQNAAAANSIADNLKRLGLESGEVCRTDALNWVNSAVNSDRKFDVVFVDPPFSSSAVSDIFEALDTRPLFSENCKLYIESPVPLESMSTLQNWQQVKSKKAGKVFFSLWKYTRRDLKG